MAEKAVVIGSGPGGLRAAAVLRRKGREVTLLQTGHFLGGINAPEIAPGRGVAARAPRSEVLGPWKGIAASRGVLGRGKVQMLPLNTLDVVQLVKPGDIPSAGAAWGKARGVVELHKLIGGGHEQRLYRHWVERRFGTPLYEALFAEYGKKRFGDPEQITCNAARLVHGVVTEDLVYAPEMGPEAQIETFAKGVEVVTGAEIQKIEAGKVTTSEGAVEGQVFVEAPPATVLGWLGIEDDAPVWRDARPLRARNAMSVLLIGGDELPQETHVLDGDIPFFRLTRPGLLPGGVAGTLLAHYAVEGDDPLWRRPDAEVVSATVELLEKAGVKGVRGTGPVLRLEGQHPTWEMTHLTRMRRYVLEAENHGVTPVGRVGTHSLMDLGEELDYLEAASEEDRVSLRECFRVYVEPPVLDAEERTHLRRLIER